MSLKEALEARVALGKEKIPNEIVDIMGKATQNLKETGISNKALTLGATFPEFNLPNEKGELKTLKNVKGEKATVISFYRGGWCPYCNIELQALQKALPEFKNLGANLIAVTPETPDNSLTTSEKNKIDFSVISDINNQLGKEMDLVFQLPKEIQEIYKNKFSIDLEKHNQNKDSELPLAATYVIDDKNEVKYAFLNEDYTKRAEISEILDVLKTI